MNAKELQLSKLNATTKTLGMYIYGIAIGMDFRDIAKILMSDLALIISLLLDGDIFAGRDGFSKLLYVFDYFEKGPKRALGQFNVTVDKNDIEIQSPLLIFTQEFYKLFGEKRDKKGNLLPISEGLSLFSRYNYTLKEKLDFIENLRDKYKSTNSAVELYNLLIDFVEDYIQLAHTVFLNKDLYEDLKTLSKGAEEMRILGSILSLNQGLDTSIDEMLALVNLIERAIYNITKDENDLVDLTKFVFDYNYRQECINRYEEVKHSFNIYDVVSTIPHFMGYLLTLALNLSSQLLSFKFRSIKNLTFPLSQILNYKKEDRIVKGVSNFVGDYMRNSWMLSLGLTIVVPKGNKAFDEYGNSHPLTEDTPIKLGTDWGNATFRLFMENEIIPNLQKGILNANTQIGLPSILNNKFILDLGNDLLTNTISKNPSIVYTLPINMMPRVDSERAVLNQYKAEFNKLAKYSYLYLTTLHSNEGTIEQKIPLVDLFTYYAMIANGWKPGEKSLVHILENFLNRGIIDNFHKYISMLDKSNESLVLGSFELNDILPYVAPFESPYSSHSEYILYRNPNTKKYLLMSKESYTDYDFGDGPSSSIQGYNYMELSVDTNYFPSGVIQSTNRRINFQFNDDRKTNRVTIKYNLDSGNILTVLVNGTELKIPEITQIPTVKKDGVKLVNIELLESVIKNKMNPC